MRKRNTDTRYLRLAALLAFAGAAGRRIFPGTPAQPRPQTVIIRVELITPGGQHAWCESNVGRIRKPLAAVPRGLLAEFYRGAA